MSLKETTKTVSINIASIVAALGLYTAGVDAGFFQKVAFAGDIKQAMDYTDRRFVMYRLAEGTAQLHKTILSLELKVQLSEAEGNDETIARDHILELKRLMKDYEQRLEACQDPDSVCY